MFHPASPCAPAPLLAASAGFAPFGPHEQWIRAFHQVSGFSEPSNSEAFLQDLHPLGLINGAANEIQRQKGVFWLFQARQEAIPDQLSLPLRNEAILLERLMGVTHPVKLALFQDVDEKPRTARAFLNRHFPVEYGMALTLAAPGSELLDTSHQFFYPKSKRDDPPPVQQARVLSALRFQNRDVQLQAAANSWARLADYRLPGQTFNEVSRHRSIGLNSSHLTRLGGLTLMGLTPDDLMGNYTKLLERQVEPVDILLVGGRMDISSWDRFKDLLEIMAPRLVIMPSTDKTKRAVEDETWTIQLGPVTQAAGMLSYFPAHNTLRLKVVSTENDSDEVLIDERIDFQKKSRIYDAVDKLHDPVEIKLSDKIRSDLADPQNKEAIQMAQRRSHMLLGTTTPDVKRYLEGLGQNPYLEPDTRRGFLRKLQLRHWGRMSGRQLEEPDPILAEQLYHGVELYLQAWGMR